MRFTLTLAAATALLVVAPASAQTQTGTQTQTPARTRVGSQFQGQAPAANPSQVAVGNQGQASATQAGVSDALFAAAAADSGLTEVSLSQLGAQKATDPELKRFSQQMIEEHTRMNAELMAMAGQKGMALPRTIDFRSQFCAQSLAGLSGEEFDKCYAKAQFVAHMDAVAMFEAEAHRGMDRDVMGLASKALPRIKDHLKMIKPIAKKYMKEEEEKGHTRIGAERPAGSR
jgi:putative membrane protein